MATVVEFNKAKREWSAATEQGILPTFPADISETALVDLWDLLNSDYCPPEKYRAELQAHTERQWQAFLLEDDEREQELADADTVGAWLSEHDAELRHGPGYTTLILEKRAAWLREHPDVAATTWEGRK